MGIFGNNKKGWQCERNSEDGSQTCTRFEVQGREKIATGTVATVSVDPSTCQMVVSGNVNSMLDDEMADLKLIGASMTATCRKGIA